MTNATKEPAMQTATAAVVAPASGKKNVLSYYLKVKGVYGRNRSVKFTVIDLVKDLDPSSPGINDQELKGMMMDIVERMKLKQGVAIISEQPEEVEEHTGTGYTSRSFVMFSDRQVMKLTRVPGADDVLTIGGSK
jgi:hypothetical protein